MTKKIILPILSLGACLLINCGGGNSAKHKIKFAGDNYYINGNDPKGYTIDVEPGKQIKPITGITPDYGYDLPPTITIDAFKVGEYGWDPEKGEIDFKDLKMPDKDIKITITVIEQE